MLKKLGVHIKGFTLPSVLTPVIMVLEVIMEMVIPLLMAQIIDDGVKAGNMAVIFKVGGLMLLAAVFGLLLGILGGICAAKASGGFARNLRKAMFENIQTFSFANIDHFSTAGLITRLTTDITNVQMAYQMMLRMFVRAPITLLIAMCMSFYINSRIAMIYLAAVLALGTVIALIMVTTVKYFQQVFKKYDDLNASVQENISAIRVVKAYVREDYERTKFAKASENIYRMFVNAEKRITLNMPIMMATIYSCMLLISWVGAHMIVSSGATQLTTGELTSLLAYCINILTSLMIMSMLFVMVTMSYASAQRIVEVLDEKATLTNPENPDHDIPDGSVDFDHVFFHYKEGDADNDTNVLRDIDLHIASGETIGIIGGTGSSKTTLVNLISRLYEVSEGRVCVGGKDVRTYDLETLRNQVAVVLQKNVLFSGTILENLRWGDEHATDEECIRVCRLACADEFIEQFPDGYQTYIEQGGTNVSGGQKQRICIARALLKKPKVLILDDSTSAVDTATDAKIRKAFREEIPGTTKIIIAQRISSVMDADRILVLDNGTINGIGTHEELIGNNAIYREVYESQTQNGGDFDQPGGDN